MGYTAHGDFDGITEDNVTSAPSTDSPNISRDTPAKNKESPEESKFKNEAQQEVEQTKEDNVLNRYRNITYHWTFAGLNKTYLKTPESYRTGELDLVILKSGGKGYTGISTNVAGIETKVGEETIREGGRVLGKKDIMGMDYSASAVVEGFNKDSPGRFDMFIENVEIESIMSFSQTSSTSLPNKFKFDVIEPFSMNGFIEALHVASVAAGYPSYLQASFVLKLEFWGYPDSGDFSEPVKIPKSERYFPLGITGIEVTISERGTKYIVSAVPHNERAFGEPNVLKKSIKMEGNDVQGILLDLMGKVTTQVKLSQEEGQTDQTDIDEYHVTFPVYDEDGNIKEGEINDIGKAKLVEILKENALYKMIDPGESTQGNAYKATPGAQPTAQETAKQPEKYKYVPGQTVVQFPEKMNIHEAIVAVIRDSSYLTSLLEKIAAGGGIDDYGMVDYFMVRMEVVNKDVINPTTQKPYQKYTYVVAPYKVHVTKVPNYASLKIAEKKYKKLSTREYNYIYTGKNIDVLNFKLEFNNLYFEAVPSSMGKQNVPGAKTAAGPEEKADPKNKGYDPEESKKSVIPTAPVRNVAEATAVQYSGIPGNQPDTDPFSALAKNMHNAIVNSSASMINGEIEILGDPFFLVTGGMGNYIPKAESRQKSVTGEVLQNYGSVLITINFRNPIDYNSFENGGMMYFDPKRVPFSGVYQVLSATHTFKDGQFKQRLTIIRQPGQILDLDLKASDPADQLKLEASDDRLIADATRSQSPAQRADSSSIREQLNRGIPTPTSNFTNATGGLGGSGANYLNQTMGLNVGLGTRPPNSAAIGNPLTGDPLSNVRLNSSGLAGLTQGSNLGTAALVAVAANVLTGNLPAKRAIGVVAGGLVGAAIASAIKKPNQGSGIGDGTTVPVTNILPTNPTAMDVKYGATIDPTSLSAGSVSSIADTAKSLGTNALNAVSGVGAGISGLVGGVSDKVSSMLGSPSDPSGIAARAGVDASMMSGLSPNMTSALPAQIANIVKNTPADVDLVQAKDQGLVLDYLPASRIANIPPTAPYSTAPLPETNVNYVNSVVASKGISGLENLYGVTNVNNISSGVVPGEVVTSALNNLPTAQTNPLLNVTPNVNSVDAGAYSDRLSTVKSQLSGITGSPSLPDVGINGSISSAFGSASAKTSPLTKLVSKVSTPTPSSDLNDFYG